MAKANRQPGQYATGHFPAEFETVQDRSTQTHQPCAEPSVAQWQSTSANHA